MEADTRVVPSVNLDIPLLGAVPPSQVGAIINSSDVLDATESVSQNVSSGVAPAANVWTSPRGLKLKLYKVNRMVVAEAGSRIDMPEIPKVLNPDQDRWESNPNDPDYLEAVQLANLRRSMACVNVYLALGTKPVEVPSELTAWEDETWATDLEELGLDIPPATRKNSRYCAWLRFYALEDDDFTALLRATMLYSGHVSEEQVAEVVDSFRSDGSGGADNGSTSAEENPS